MRAQNGPPPCGWALGKAYLQASLDKRLPQQQTLGQGTQGCTERPVVMLGDSGLGIRRPASGFSSTTNSLCVSSKPFYFLAARVCKTDDTSLRLERIS